MGLKRCQERKMRGKIRADPTVCLLTPSMIMGILGLGSSLQIQLSQASRLPASVHGTQTDRIIVAAYHARYLRNPRSEKPGSMG